MVTLWLHVCIACAGVCKEHMAEIRSRQAQAMLHCISDYTKQGLSLNTLNENGAALVSGRKSFK